MHKAEIVTVPKACIENEQVNIHILFSFIN